MSETRMIATIKRGPFGLWHVRATGNGYPSEVALVDSAQSERWLSALVEDGFSIVDPLHFCEMYGVLSEPISQYEDSQDAAEAPAVAMVGSVPGDNGDNAWPYVEVRADEGGPRDDWMVL